MTKKTLNAQIEQLLDGLDSQEEIAEATKLLHKRFFERSMNAELDDHLGYSKHKPSTNSNSRNGSTRKRLQTEDGKLEIDTPRDREGPFEPQILKKRQTRVPTLDSKITFLYSQGSTAREIVETLEELYGTEISPTLVSRVTEAVLEDVIEWQSRPLDDVYPIVYLDCIVVKVRHDKRVINTTNAIESLKSVIRKVIKKRKLFPSDESANKVVYLATQNASKKCTMPIRNWKSALNRFMIEFEDRLSDYS